MSVLARTSITLPVAPAPGIYVFATLSFIEAIARALVITLMALQSYEIFGSARSVSHLSTLVGVASFIAGLFVPILIRFISRRWTYTAGGLVLIASAICLASYSVPGQIAGLALRSFGTACLNITASLYLMDYIRKHQLVRADATRMVAATTGWTVGPYLGIWLAETVHRDLVYGLSAGFALVLIGYFWYLRLTEPTILIAAKHPPLNPARFVARFVSQPRLRLAWLIAFGRSAFWSTLFIYGPILMVEAGQGREMGGLLVSMANLTLVTAMLWGLWAERRGIRYVTTLCFVGMALTLIIVGFAGRSAPFLAAAMLLVTSLFASGLDAVGGVPFYRAVKPRERTPMSGVYRSYIDFGELLPNAVYGVLLGLFGLGSVFVALGVFLLAVAVTTWRHLPRSL